jgi:hypothetical protein
MRVFVLYVALVGSVFAAEQLPIPGLAHVGFKVCDHAKARSYYAGVLGFHEASISRIHPAR